MDSSSPMLVSCIMPTSNRRKFIPFALHYFLRQDYEHKELIIIDDGTDRIGDLIPEDTCIRYYQLDKPITLGEKLNLACTYAKGEIIAHWDDDDWYDAHRISYQVGCLQHSEAEVCGINHLLYLNLSTWEAYQYIYPSDEKPWLLGSSLCYSKSLWKQIPFAPINVGMDALFVWSVPAHSVMQLPQVEMSVHMIHKDNVSPKKTTGTWWHSYPVEELQRIMRDDWHSYSIGVFTSSSLSVTEKVAEPTLRSNASPIQNVYACLVHEQEDCVIDLVRNLHYQDPDSRILLYNGGKNPDLLRNAFPYEYFGCEICPDPIPLEHGYLHAFALKSMEFAVNHYSFDTLTIVDSDQLAIRKGYPHFLSSFLNSNPGVGLLSNRPEKISSIDTEIWTASQAFKELELWRPFLKQFRNWEDKFVHWSFWPSTVFTADAIKDVLKLFRDNVQLQRIMAKTKIWATEEIIFPTLVRLLGYEIGQNPCSHDYVNYRKSYVLEDFQKAAQKPNAFWMHPVTRDYHDPIRKQVRQKFNRYIDDGKQVKEKKTVALPLMLPLLEKVKNIQGWLAEKEADLLIATTLKACCSLPPPHHLVEIGSYHGKSTVAIGSVIKDLFPKARLFAIDPHEGTVGATDQVIQKTAPTLESFESNIRTAGLTDHVLLIQEYSYHIDWSDPIIFLFIDGLHDYLNVARDFWKFSPHVVPGGFVVFHDYADYYPGVMALVDEVLASGQYQKVELSESLMVVQKT